MIGQLLYYVLWILHFNIILSFKKFIFNKLLIYVFQSIFFFLEEECMFPWKSFSPYGKIFQEKYKSIYIFQRHNLQFY